MTWEVSAEWLMSAVEVKRLCVYRSLGHLNLSKLFSAGTLLPNPLPQSHKWRTISRKQAERELLLTLSNNTNVTLPSQYVHVDFFNVI